MADTSQDRIITKFEDLSDTTKSAIAANAASQGITPQEYLNKRGGVEATTKKFGDSYNPEVDLTAAEYAQVMADAKAKGLTGYSIGEAINAATAKKRGISLYEYTGGVQGTPTKSPAKILSQTVNEDGNTVIKYSNGTVQILDADGNVLSTRSVSLKTGTQIATDTKAAEDKEKRQSAYDLLFDEFNKYGLGSLVEDAKNILMDAPNAAAMSIALQNTKAYQQRFAANQDRIKAGLRALTPAEYIGLEDQYQKIMRNYGLPATYYTKDAMGTQAGFNKFIANDVSAAELEDRIATAQKRVLNADVNVTNALRQFYPDITNADILAYTLDPTNALESIKRKVTAAEIGGAALAQGLATGASRAEELAKYGITKAQAQQGYQAIGEFLPTAEKLGDIYAKQGLGPFDQLTAESEVFGTAGSAQAGLKRKKLSELERATFSGSAGAAGGALDRGRQGAY